MGFSLRIPFFFLLSGKRMVIIFCSPLSFGTLYAIRIWAAPVGMQHFLSPQAQWENSTRHPFSIEFPVEFFLLASIAFIIHLPRINCNQNENKNKSA